MTNTAGHRTVDRPATVVQAVRRWAAERADSTAVVVTDVSAKATERADFGDLDRRSRAVAVALRRVASPGAPVLIACPTGMDFVTGLLGCLYAGLIAVPIGLDDRPANRPRSKADRLHGVLRDAQPSVVITTRAAADSEFVDRVTLVAAEVPSDLADQWQEPAVRPEHPALLQYTSGSTRSPRGVVVTHQNIVANTFDILAATGAGDLAPDDFRLVSWLPLFHDMGLFQLMSALAKGGRITLLPPVAFLMRPRAWLEIVSRERAFATTAPDFAYALCAARADNRCDDLDLSSVRALMNGAETVRHSTLAAFTHAFADAGLDPEVYTPCYGLAEAMCFVTGGREPADPRYLDLDADLLERDSRATPATPASPVRRVVGCGRPAASLEVLIVDPETRLACAPLEVGEIWAAGSSIAAGYWNNPEATASKFHGRLADTGRGPFLRTGDLGFMADGQLFVLGRMDDVIIIDGRNHFPHDIEATVGECHSELAAEQTVAFWFTADGQTRLGVAVEVADFIAAADAAADAAEQHTRGIEAAVRRSVAAQHGVQPYAVSVLPLGGLPRTTSGKPQRYRCRDLVAANP